MPHHECDWHTVTAGRMPTAQLAAARCCGAYYVRARARVVCAGGTWHEGEPFELLRAWLMMAMKRTTLPTALTLVGKYDGSPTTILDLAITPSD